MVSIMSVRGLDRWEAESRDQVGIAEHDDAGDARGGRGEYGNPERLVGAVAAAEARRRGGLPIGGGQNHPPVSAPVIGRLRQAARVLPPASVCLVMVSAVEFAG